MCAIGILHPSSSRNQQAITLQSSARLLMAMSGLDYVRAEEVAGLPVIKA